MNENGVNQDGVNVAFTLILGELENVIQDLTAEGTQAFQKRQYDEAVSLSKTGTELATFQEKVRDLQHQWIQGFDTTTRDKAQVERMTRLSPRKRSPKTTLKVTFPDGHIICDTVAAQTFVKVMVELGLDRVKSLGLTINGFPLISHQKSETYNQYKEGNNYIMTHSATDQKKRLLEEIAKKLNAKIRITTVK
jgi:hypothetical protein